MLSETHGVFAKFISGKIIDSLIVGVLTFIIMNIAGIPYTILISVLIGVTNIIPFFGQYIGIIPVSYTHLDVYTRQDRNFEFVPAIYHRHSCCSLLLQASIEKKKMEEEKYA